MAKGGERPGSGRPKKPADERKTRRVLYLDDYEFEHVREALEKYRQEQRKG